GRRATHVPEPCRNSTRRSARRRLYAETTVVRLSERLRASPRSDGSLVPTGSAPLAIAARSAAARSRERTPDDGLRLSAARTVEAASWDMARRLATARSRKQWDIGPRQARIDLSAGA